MTLKTKLVLAQAPLAVALAAIGAVSGLVTNLLGEQATKIMDDNYRSVLAAQRMKDSLERMDSGALLMLLGRATDNTAEMTRHQAIFEAELRVEEANITEPHEQAAAARLRSQWIQYRTALQSFRGLPDQVALKEAYFGQLSPGFGRLKHSAEEILAINQDAMVRKSVHAEERAERFQRLLVAAVFLAALMGLVASIWFTTRLLRPMGIVAAAVRRFGQGDLQARVRVDNRDEIGQLATEFNTMADRLERYRASSLGELIAAQQAAQAAIDGLPDPVVLLDPEGKVSGLNRAATAILGIDPEKAGDLLAGVDPGIRAVLDRFRAHVMGGKGAYVPRGFEEAIRLALAEGERIFLPRATPIYGESGEITGVSVVYQDITRVFRSDELKNDLVATVAHEFRTPLTSLRMAIHLMLEEAVGPLSSKQADLLQAGREDCERLQDIVDELLTLSRIESGRIDVHKRRIDPDSLIDMALDVHRTAAEDRHVRVRAEVPPGCPEAFADPDRMQLVFSNLISNAIRYSPEGGEIVVSARAEFAREAAPSDRHSLKSPGWIRFEVRDQGPGIPAEHQEHLFEKFFRVPGSPEGGSGLGLFISRGIVQAHGGRIGQERGPGGGATFWFTIPAAPEVPSGAGS